MTIPTLSPEGRRQRVETLQARLTALHAAAHRGEASWQAVEAARRQLNAAIAGEAAVDRGELSRRLYEPHNDEQEA